MKYYYPVSVSGPLAKVMESYVKEFNDSHPQIHVTPIYSGDYTQTMTKVQAAVKGGDMPDVAVLLHTDVLNLRDMDAIVPLDSFVKSDKDGQDYVNDYFPAFIDPQKIDNHLWSIPYQRSTPVLYYNKQMFQDAGLDPNKPPANWSELEADAKKLTKRDSSGNVTQWGMEGNLYIIKTTDAKEKAAWEFVRFMTSPEMSARWSMDSGYVAPRKAAYDVQSYKDYSAKFPQALVARDQLQYADAELTTHNNGQIYKILSDTEQNIFLGHAAMDQALKDAQEKIDQIVNSN